MQGWAAEVGVLLQFKGQRLGCSSSSGGRGWDAPPLRGTGGDRAPQQLRGGRREEDGPPQTFSASRSGSVPWKTKGPGGRGGEEKPD